MTQIPLPFSRFLLWYCLVISLAFFAFPTFSQSQAFTYPQGQKPTSVPQLFSPGFVNTGLITRDVTMTPDGKEIYFCQAIAGYRQAAIFVTKKEGLGWGPPEVASFSGSSQWIDLEPFVSPDGDQLFFYSSRPVEPGGDPAQDIWVVDRVGSSWGEPRNLGAPINSEAAEFFPAVTADNTIYFCRADPQTRLHSLYRSRWAGGQYQAPEMLPEAVNSGVSQFNAWVSPDESRMIIPVAGHPKNNGGVDYWLALRDEDDSWSGPFNLGPAVNDGSPGSWSPYVSPDGEAFFFMSGRTVGVPLSWPTSWFELQEQHQKPGSGRPSIFWMKADFLDQMALKPGSIPEAQAVKSEMRHGASRMAWIDHPGPYLGQNPPGLKPEIFAPGMVSTGMNERDIVFTPDGNSIYFGVMDQGLVTLMVTRNPGDIWNPPVTAGFHVDPDWACFEPTFSQDGNQVFFLTNQAAPGQEQGRGWANQNIFTSRRVDGVWSDPVAVEPPVTSDAAEYFPSVAADGTLYFSREDEEGNPFLWAAEPKADGFLEPVRLPDTVNVGTSCYNAFVAPDEKFLIACVAGHEANLGPADYWISVKNENGQWDQAQNMGPIFNGPEKRASSAFLTPDGKYLFFSSSEQVGDLPDRWTREGLHRLHGRPGNGASDIWWVDAEILNSFF